MNKIYVCQANGIENRKFIKIIFFCLALCFALFYLLSAIEIIKINNNFIDEEQLNNTIMLILSILGVYSSSYKLLPPRLHIDSLNNLLIYLGKRVHYSTKLENIHHFSIAEDGIILHSDKTIKIPFLEFEDVDLTSFANSMNKVIKTNVDFHAILNEDNKIQGFNYLDEDNTKDLRSLMQGGILTKDVKELETLGQKFILTKNWWWSHEFPILFITTMVIILSIIEFTLWYFT